LFIRNLTEFAETANAINNKSQFIHLKSMVLTAGLKTALVTA